MEMTYELDSILTLATTYGQQFEKIYHNIEDLYIFLYLASK